MRKIKKAFIIASLYVFTGSTAVITSQAAELSQSSRWVGAENKWQVSDGSGGYLYNIWFQDDITKDWYLLGAEDGSVMFSGLITDQSTGKTYLLNPNHDGTYGRMLTVDGTYTINGVDVYLTFNQEHNGAFGCITSGLSEVRNTGIEEKQLPSIPSDSQSTPSAKPSWEGKASLDLTPEELDAKYFGTGLGDGTGSKIQLKH